MNPIMSWPVFSATFILFLLLSFCRPSLRGPVIAVASALLALWLVDKYAIVMLASLELLFWLLKLRGDKEQRPRFDIWASIGVGIGLLPFIILLVHPAFGSPGGSLGTAAFFAFFSLQLVSGFLHLWLSGEERELRRSEWYVFGLFFPTLVTGPILRWPQMLAQLRTPKPFHIGDGIECLRLLTRGLFKRLVFASACYLIVEEAISQKAIINLPLLLAFAMSLRFAIWADISAHTDWASCLALLLGFELPQNFNRPFQTVSVLEFWRRWHITLTTWFQDFIYFPVVSASPLRRLSSAPKVTIAVLVSFSALGLWHGFKMSFFAMGLIKGAGILIAIGMFRKWPGLYRVVSPLLLIAFVILPTALLKLDWSSFYHAALGTKLSWASFNAQVENIFTLFTRDGTDMNPLGWIAGTAIVWQFYEKAESLGCRLPALVEAALLIAGTLVLATYSSEARFLYVAIGR